MATAFASRLPGASSAFGDHPTFPTSSYLTGHESLATAAGSMGTGTGVDTMSRRRPSGRSSSFRQQKGHSSSALPSQAPARATAAGAAAGVTAAAGAAAAASKSLGGGATRQHHHHHARGSSHKAAAAASSSASTRSGAIVARHPNGDPLATTAPSSLRHTGSASRIPRRSNSRPRGMTSLHSHSKSLQRSDSRGRRHQRHHTTTDVTTATSAASSSHRGAIAAYGGGSSSSSNNNNGGARIERPPSARRRGSSRRMVADPGSGAAAGSVGGNSGTALRRTGSGSSLRRVASTGRGLSAVAHTGQPNSAAMVPRRPTVGQGTRGSPTRRGVTGAVAGGSSSSSSSSSSAGSGSNSGSGSGVVASASSAASYGRRASPRQSPRWSTGGAGVPAGSAASLVRHGRRRGSRAGSLGAVDGDMLSSKLANGNGATISATTTTTTTAATKAGRVVHTTVTALDGSSTGAGASSAAVGGAHRMPRERRTSLRGLSAGSGGSSGTTAATAQRAASSAAGVGSLPASSGSAGSGSTSYGASRRRTAGRYSDSGRQGSTSTATALAALNGSSGRSSLSSGGAGGGAGALPGGSNRKLTQHGSSNAISAASNAGAEGHSGDPGGLVGLYNLGNTCFMNSCLQCLSNTPVLTRFFVSGAWQKELCSKSPTKGKLAKAYNALMQRMWARRSSSAERPQELKKIVGQVAPRFIGYDQHDAQEFLRFFLDSLHEDLNRVVVKPKYVELKEEEGASDKAIADMYWKNYTERNDSLVKDAFCGQLRSVLTCQTCGHTSRCFDPFWDLSVPIPKKSQVKEKRFGRALNFGRGSNDSVSCSVEECIKEYCSPETLVGAEAVTCAKCKSSQPTRKDLHIYRLPHILVVHIKRFSYSMFRRDKLTTSVRFPPDGIIDVAPYLADSAPRVCTKFRLIGVANHMGGLGGGHYTADCRNKDDGSWHNFNDSRVSGSSSSRLSGSAAYLLFFERTDGKLG